MLQATELLRTSGQSRTVGPAQPAGQSQAIEQLRDAIDVLRECDVEASSDEAICEQIVMLHRQINRLQAAWSQRVAVADGRAAAAAGGYLTTASFLRHCCQLTPGAARRRVDADTALADHPAVAEAYGVGTISQPHVAEIVLALQTLPAEIVIDAEPVLIQAAEHLDVHRLKQTIRRLRAITDPDGQAASGLARDEQQWLDAPLGFDGMTPVAGLLDRETGAALRTILDSLDQPVTGDTRTASRRRADNLGELLRRILDSGELPVNGGERPHLTVTVDLATLRKQPFSPPAELDFGDLLSADAARRLGCDALITRIITDNDGAEKNDGAGIESDTGNSRDKKQLGPGDGEKKQFVPDLIAGLAGDPPSQPRFLLNALPPPLSAPSLALDVGRTARVVPPHIRKALNLRDKGCVFDGCGAPPPWCHAHHLIHWADGGPTSLWNLVLLCTRHHHHVHDLGWDLKLNTDGTITTIPPNRALALT